MISNAEKNIILDKIDRNFDIEFIGSGEPKVGFIANVKTSTI